MQISGRCKKQHNDAVGIEKWYRKKRPIILYNMFEALILRTSL